MPYIIVNESGAVAHYANGQYMVFKTSDEAMQFIKNHKGSSPYLKPKELKRNNTVEKQEIKSTECQKLLKKWKNLYKNDKNL